MPPTLASQLRPRRSAAGLTQGDLAERVGLSRQAIVAIEAGRQVPSTLVALQLARVLGCAVEDLFALPAAPHLQAVLAAPLPTGGALRLSVGRVDGVWVAHPLSSFERPGDAVLAGEIDAGGRVAIEPLRELSQLEHNVLVAGCAPLLGLLTARLQPRGQDARATWVPAHSSGALELLAAGRVHVAGVHLVGTAQSGGHASLVRQWLPGQSTTLVNLTCWRQGLVIAPGNPRGIHGVEDVLREDVRLVRREAGAAAQRLLEEKLRERGLDAGRLEGALTAVGHTEVARLVRLGLVDAGVAIESAALAEGLDFLPLSEERFDLIVPSTRLAETPVAQLLELIDRPAFRAEASRIAGYDLSVAGQVSTVGAR